MSQTQRDKEIIELIALRKEMEMLVRYYQMEAEQKKLAETNG